MPLKDSLKITRKTFFNPTGWLGYEMLATQSRVLWNLVRGLFVVPEAGRAETFEQATERFRLSDEQLNEVARNFQIYTIIFMTCGVITFLFSLYLLFFHGTFAGLLIGLATTAVFCAYAFRYSFWRFEIRHRKLGATFREWLHDKPKKEV